ncbi:MAG: hydrogenase iron-sulfur subunit, partial [Deltaproteobacteria bacterium]|nr:hydrogenase iron-sulfur subunit [Deltaproteobacteria bacterium]
IHLLNTLEDGADGVYVAGCMEGDCHFLTGNIKTRRKVEYVQRILETLGVEKERVAMYNLSAAQGPRFVEIAKEFTAKITELGPSPFAKPQAAAA